MSLRLWGLIGGAVALLALVAGAYFEGKRAGGNAMARQVQARIDRQAEAQRRIDRAAQAVDRELAAADTARRDEVRRIYVEVPRVVERPVYGSVWADADGVQLLRRGVAAANGQPGGTAVGGAAD